LSPDSIDIKQLPAKLVLIGRGGDWQFVAGHRSLDGARWWRGTAVNSPRVAISIAIGDSAMIPRRWKSEKIKGLAIPRFDH
jgi:hypothetical protein